MKKILLSLSLILTCILAIFASFTPRPDADKDLLFNALYSIHTEGLDPAAYTAYGWDGEIISNFYEITAPMNRRTMHTYCREHIQSLTKLEISDDQTLRDEPMKTANLHCFEAYHTPDGRYLSIQYTVTASAIYDETGDTFSYTYAPDIGRITYALPKGWSYDHLGQDVRESIRKTDGHAYFFHQFNSYGTWLGTRYDLGQSRRSFTIAP